MFDWPEQSQISPANTFVNTTCCFAPLMVSVNGPPAGNGPIFVCHLPSAPATAVALVGVPLGFSTVTVMVSPGLLQPQIGSATSRCSIMSLVKSVCTKGNLRGCVGHVSCGSGGVTGGIGGS